MSPDPEICGRRYLDNKQKKKNQNSTEIPSHTS